MLDEFDYVVFGAGVFGMYASLLAAQKGYRVALVDSDMEPFRRASYVNQARLHNGYHYPRSVTTALKCAEYYRRFAHDFDFAVNSRYKSIYGVSSAYSFVTAEQFRKFSSEVGIFAQRIDPQPYFSTSHVEAAFETQESSFDAFLIRQYLLERLRDCSNCVFKFGYQLDGVELFGDKYRLCWTNGRQTVTENIVNATYAGTNRIQEQFGFEPLPLKYELTEVILVNVNGYASEIGVTLMDGPFFSLMPFGLSGYHSLTSVEYTPHAESQDRLPFFDCQSHNVENCTPRHLGDCRVCPTRPITAWPYMYQLCRTFLAESIKVDYADSLYTIKTVLATAEVDDSRPTIIRELSRNPRFVSILSGKFNTIYDLEDVIL